MRPFIFLNSPIFLIFNMDTSDKPFPDLACSLSAPELQNRKATVLNLLKTQISEQNELENGFSFKFTGNDEIMDNLVSFIKSERQCCPFFTFNLVVGNDKDSIWLHLTGPAGAKEFIKSEIGWT
jgi:hypothetical protein